MLYHTIVPVLAASAFAILAKAQSIQAHSILAKGFKGVATFNDYQLQGPTVCSPNGIISPLHEKGATKVWGAAAGDISPYVSRGLCPPHVKSDPMSRDNCTGGTNVPTYQGPSCPKSAYCDNPTCYKVTNTGAFDHGKFGSGGAVPTGHSIIVQIIDVCPVYHAMNYCATSHDKSEKNLQQHCQSSSVDALDIDTHAYGALTGKKGKEQHHMSGDPNLNIHIVPVACPHHPAHGSSAILPSMQQNLKSPA